MSSPGISGSTVATGSLREARPEHGDAYFMLGAYNYYVEIVPSFVKLIRPLLFLPAGNRVEGLKQLERAYTQGPCFRFRPACC